MEISTYLKNFVIQLLRRGSYKWSERSKAKAAARTQDGEFSTGRPKFKYKCAMCGNLFMEKEVCLDHINPVVPPEGFQRGEFDFHEYITRMFCSAEGFQVLCSECHDKKTKEEIGERKLHRKPKPEKAKKSSK
jgi:5-methylcytosine-specific restriction endonuclease McrA